MGARKKTGFSKEKFSRMAKGKVSRKAQVIAPFPVKNFAKATQVSDGVLTDLPQTTDDFRQEVLESSPKFTMLAKHCVSATEFSQQRLATNSMAWALPYMLNTASGEYAEDTRGTLVKLLETQCSFKNLSSEAIRIHANCPVAHENVPGAVNVRLSGFRKNGVLTDDITLGPGAITTFAVDWSPLKDLMPITTNVNPATDGTTSGTRMWMNCITFCVEIKNVNPATGDGFDLEAEIVSLVPKAKYWKRKTNPLPLADGDKMVIQDSQNFCFNELGQPDSSSGHQGLIDLYHVDAINVESSKATSNIDAHYAADKVIFAASPGRTLFCQDAANEGTLFGIAAINLGKYASAYLMVKNFEGVFVPLQLHSRRGADKRVMVPGLTLASDNRDATFSYSYFKWDPTVIIGDDHHGGWMLYDENTRENRECDPTLGIETVISSYCPLMIIDGVNAPKKDYDGFVSPYGQAYGSPKNFGKWIAYAGSVFNILSRVIPVILEA